MQTVQFFLSDPLNFCIFVAVLFLLLCALSMLTSFVTPEMALPFKNKTRVKGFFFWFFLAILCCALLWLASFYPPMKEKLGIFISRISMLLAVEIRFLFCLIFLMVGIVQAVASLITPDTLQPFKEKTRIKGFFFGFFLAIPSFVLLRSFFSPWVECLAALFYLLLSFSFLLTFTSLTTTETALMFKERSRLKGFFFWLLLTVLCSALIQYFFPASSLKKWLCFLFLISSLMSAVLSLASLIKPGEAQPFKEKTRAKGFFFWLLMGCISFILAAFCT